MFCVDLCSMCDLDMRSGLCSTFDLEILCREGSWGCKIILPCLDLVQIYVLLAIKPCL